MNIDEQLNNKEQNLIEGYFNVHKHYEDLYGPNTIVMIELGSFFEIYGVENEKIQIGKAREIADLLNIQLTRRNKTIKQNSIKNPLMAGFPSPTFDRYINRIIQEKKYTVVVIRQKGVPPKVSRYVDKIISPGVNIDYCLDHADNFITSIVIEKDKQDLHSVGYAALDISTGKTFVFEGHSTKEDKTAALDELFSLVHTHNMAECIFVLNNNLELKEILNYLELSEFNQIQIRNKRLNINYQNELFKRAYIIKSFLTPIEFLDIEKNPITSEALAHLLEFVVEHDSKVIENLKKPKIIEANKFLYLGNNPLDQLNIISKDNSELTLLSHFDYTSTSIGKRLFKDRICHPITDKDEILSRYDLSDSLISKQKEIHQELKKIYDLERLVRRIKLTRLHPFEINFLYESLISSQEILKHLDDLDNKVLSEFCNSSQKLNDFIKYIDDTFNLDETSKVTNQTINTSFFNKNIDSQLSNLLDQKQILTAKLEIIREKFVNLINKTTGKLDVNFVTIKKPDKDRHHLVITKGRFNQIEHLVRETFITIDGTVYALSDFDYKIQTTNVKISSQIIKHISKELTDVESQIVVLVKELFAKQLDYIDKHFSDYLYLCTETIAKIDVAISNIICSKQHRLVRPNIIDNQDDKSYLDIKQLRHPLVEAKEEQGIYVPNDVILDSNDKRGILLYGINSSGKSSLMKSLGIAIILAQSGFYVSAGEMNVSLFKELFTRIVSKDNIEKGLSSFAVEMLELKNIFNRCSNKSLILGDEISHGTETLSAISIVSATIKRLSEQNALFLFTTHLHQICDLKEVSELDSVKSLHMSVHYDKNTDKLIFDRTLQPGNGSTIYGLEFAQSLHMDETFLKYALDIRKNLTNNYSDIEFLTKKTKSKYSKNLYLSTCAICKSQVDDTHHIAPQEDADQDGNIGHIHKNHKYNLLPICKNCHNDIHNQKIIVKGFMMTSHGLELGYERVD